MCGLITTRHLVLNAYGIVRGFGWACWARCVRAVLSGRRVTFLEMTIGRLDKPAGKR